jgi:hypothetical protein
MKPGSQKTILLKASALTLSAGIIMLALSLFSFSVKTCADDIWNQLGLTEQKGNENIRLSFLQGYLYTYGVKSAKNIATGNRAAVTKDLLTYAKQYTASEEFKKEYERNRQGAKPMEPWRKTAKTKEEIRKEKIAETEKSIAEMEKNMPTYTADVKKIMQPLLESQKETLKDYKDPNSQMIEMMALGEKTAVENDWKSYKEQVTKWEEGYPANMNAFIKRRLQQYLDIQSTVDFSAELKDVNGKKKFVNSAYEYKPADWKKVYRAGKEVNDVAKQFAAAWVKELQ